MRGLLQKAAAKDLSHLSNEQMERLVEDHVEAMLAGVHAANLPQLPMEVHKHLAEIANVAGEVHRGVAAVQQQAGRVQDAVESVSRLAQLHRSGAVAVHQNVAAMKQVVAQVHHEEQSLSRLAEKLRGEWERFRELEAQGLDR